MRLVILGFGYSARHCLGELRPRLSHVAATVRDGGRAAALRREGIEGHAFDGGAASPALLAAITKAEALLVSIPPNEAGDPALARLKGAIAAAPNLSWIGYLSTVGVYGDHDGAWVDEATPCQPASARSIARLAAEQGWLSLAAPARAVQILRLSGIYGPGQNALENLRAGTARRIIKPGQVFNRIHVEDIAGATAHCLMRARQGEAPPIVNVTDSEPCPPQDVVAHAATLMGLAPPPETPFAEAALSPMARSFYGENKRVSNRLLTQVLGYELHHPSYREGLAALWRDMQAQG